METESDRTRRLAIHPVEAVLLASVLPLLLGALLSDWAYAKSFEVQWINFAAWLIAGALVFGGLALLWVVVDALRARLRRRHRWMYVGFLSATFGLGLINALVHARDGWASMPVGLILSAIVLLVALAALWTGFSAPRAGDSR